MLIVGCQSLQNAAAEGDTRTISMHHLHTGESITITYKRDGHYVPEALKKLDWFLRDWREKKETHMDPHLIDLLWEVDRDVGGTEPIQIVCGYRDEHTNKMLRNRSRRSGVAVHSQHVLGKAIDFYIPRVNLAKLRALGLQLQRGGVGFYPTSGSPFVHMDVGDVRHWPRMTTEQLAKIFPDGRTVHIPKGGRPFKHFAQALLEVERHGSKPSAMSLDSAERAGAITAQERSAAESGDHVLLASLMGKQQQIAINAATPDAQTSDKATALGTPVAMVAAQTPAAPPPVRLASAAVPLPKARPAAPVVLAAALPPPPAATPARTAMTVVASVAPTPSEIVRSRFYWVGVPQAIAADDTAPPTASGAVLALADAEPTGSIAGASARNAGMAAKQLIAYAAARTQRESMLTRSAGAPTAIAAKMKPVRAAITSPARPALLDPWLDAVIVTPSVRLYLSATRYGPRDYAGLAPLLNKPVSAVAMDFTPDWSSSPTTERFSGRAIVFVDTVTFVAGLPRPFDTASIP